MGNIATGIISGSLFGAIAVAMMLPMSFPDTRLEMAGGMAGKVSTPSLRIFGQLI